MFGEMQLILPFEKQELWKFESNICNHMLPYNEPSIVPHGQISPPCLLHQEHDGPHLILTQRGEFIVWDTEYRESFPAGEVVDEPLELHWCDTTPAEAAQLLARSPVFAKASFTPG